MTQKVAQPKKVDTAAAMLVGGLGVGTFGSDGGALSGVVGGVGVGTLGWEAVGLPGVVGGVGLLFSTGTKSEEENAANAPVVAASHSLYCDPSVHSTFTEKVSPRGTN